MRALEERPRATDALAATIVVLVVAAMLAGGAIAGGDSSTPRAKPARVSSELTRARRAADNAQRQLGQYARRPAQGPAEGASGHKPRTPLGEARQPRRAPSHQP
ncbi:MAG TPA: hypothetical protein VFY45_04240 [Baekduia sp.]|nr:hypothetical protein [Baekduia sp.]